MSVRRKLARARISAPILFAVAGLALIFQNISWIEIEAYLQKIPYRCPLKLVTGFKCVFCGMTHSFIAMLKGEWSQAFNFNALGPLLLLLLIIYWGKWITQKKMPPNKFTTEKKKTFILGGLFFMILFMVLRNSFNF